MEGNNCIDKKFDHIGTDSSTLSEVANALMPCFDNEGFIFDEEISKEEYSASVEEGSSEKISSKSTEEGSKKSSETREMKESKSSESSETSKEKRSKILEKLMKSSKSSEAKISQEDQKESSSKSSESEEKSYEKTQEKLSEIDKKVYEVISNNSSNSKEEKDGGSKESISSESAEVKQIKSSIEPLEKKIKSEEKILEEKLAGESISSESFSLSDEKSSEKISNKKKKGYKNEIKDENIEEIKDDEVVATISPYEFIEQDKTTAIVEDLPTTKYEKEELEIEEIEEEEEKLSPELIDGEKVEETSTKKKKIKVKKIKKTTTEAPATTAAFSEIPEPATNFLHPYEQAWCRFFVDAENNYNCVLENVTSEVKRINTDHLSGFDSRKVAGLFLRQSVLVRLPLIFFDTFENLEYLSVENTNIKQLDEDTVKDGCGKLKSISLKNNKIRRLERHALKECENLENIDLTGNPMEYIEGDIFNYNPKLSITMGSLKLVAPALTSF
jgi:hypothetical protein